MGKGYVEEGERTWETKKGKGKECKGARGLEGYVVLGERGGK